MAATTSRSRARTPWRLSSAAAASNATAACACGPTALVPSAGQPPAASGAACATARATRSARTWAPPAAETAAARFARCGPSAVAPSGLPRRASTSAVIAAASEGVIAKPSDRALARSIVAPSTRTSRASPRAPRIARATTHPEAEACVARRWASAATKDAWSGGDTSARAAASAARTSISVMSPERAVPRDHRRAARAV